MGTIVIGAGVMGANHVRVLSSLGEEVSGVVDPDEPVGRDVAVQVAADWYGDLEAALDQPGVKHAIVASPTQHHAGIATRLIDAGIHVLVEKPLAGSMAEGAEVVAAAADARVTLAVGHIERHNPVVAFAHEALASGAVGRPITATARRASNLPGRIRDVGCILDIGIHDIDVLNHLLGPARTVFAQGGCRSTKGGLEDHASLLLRYDDDVTGIVEVNWLTPRKVRQLTFTCEEALLEADYMQQTASISRSHYRPSRPGEPGPMVAETTTDEAVIRNEEPLRREISDFLQAVRSGQPPLADGLAGLEALAVAEAALRSMASGQQEQIEDLREQQS